MKVSVIIPTHGTPSFLKQAIDSVISQTYDQWELIVVNDNDRASICYGEVLAIMDDYLSDERIKLIGYGTNYGGGKARNLGVKISRADVVSFLDDDDRYHPQRLEKCLNAYKGQTNDNIKAVFTGCEIHNPGRRQRNYRWAESGNYLKETLACTFTFYSGSNLFVSKEVYCSLGGFDEELVRHQDYDFLARYFASYDIYGISEILLIKNNLSRNIPPINSVLAIKQQYLSKNISLMDREDERSIDWIYDMNNLELLEMCIRRKEWSKFKVVVRSLRKFRLSDLKYYVKLIALILLSIDERYKV